MIDLTFKDLKLEVAKAILDYVSEVKEQLEADERGELHEPQPLVTPKRKRRTKAEMAAARAEGGGDVQEVVSDGAEVSKPEGDEVVAPKTRRTRRRGKAAETVSGDADGAPDRSPDGRGKRSRRRRGKGGDKAGGIQEGAEIPDAEVMKAASLGADKLTPKKVMNLLEQFGTQNVAELDQSQRREFIDLVTDALSEEGIPF